MARFLEHVSVVSALDGAIDGDRTRRRYRPGRRTPKITEADLDPDIAAYLVRNRVDLLRVEILSRTDVIVHNSRSWR